MRSPLFRILLGRIAPAVIFKRCFHFTVGASAPTCRVLNGQELAQIRRENLSVRVAGLKCVPRLAVLLVGHNPASEIYVERKMQAAERVGIQCDLVRFPESICQEELVSQIHAFNEDPATHAIIVQLPLPASLDANQVCSEVAPIKDVDCFTAENFGKLCHGNPMYIPCAPKAVLSLLEETGVDLVGKHATIVGRGLIVGLPLSLMLGHRGATVSSCHIATPTNVLASLCRKADIVVAAAGHPHLLNKDVIAKGAIVIDVGINRLQDGKVVGDVDFKSVVQRASVITPVPGGVGPLTVVSLLENCAQACEIQSF